MGGRGGNSGMSSGSNSTPLLNKTKVNRANGVSVLGTAGNKVERTYSRNVDEIQTLNLSDDEKKEGINRQHELATNALDIIAKNPHPYGAGMGPARINTDKVRRGADQISNAEHAIDIHMDSLRNKSRENIRKQSDARLTNALQGAMKSGALTVTVDGKEYYRTRRNSSTWRLR